MTSRKRLLAAALAAFAAGQGCGQAPSTSKPPAPVPAADSDAQTACLNDSTGFQARPPASMQQAVVAFAWASRQCGASEAELRAYARRIQNANPKLELPTQEENHENRR